MNKKDDIFGLNDALNDLTLYKKSDKSTKIYNGNSQQDYFNHATNEINELTKNMEKTELKAQEVSSKEEQLITRKRTAKMFLEDIVRQVDQGNLPATFAALQIKQLKKEFDNTLFRIEDQAKEELVGTDYYIYGDHKLTYKQGSKGVDYSECEQIAIMEKHLKEIKGKYKAALDGVEKGITQTLEDHKFIDANGEICNLPKWKYNKSSIQLTKV